MGTGQKKTSGQPPPLPDKTPLRQKPPSGKKKPLRPKPPSCKNPPPAKTPLRQKAPSGKKKHLVNPLLSLINKYHPKLRLFYIKFRLG